MSHCPKCGRHLKMSDWRQTCPDCGINMLLYNEQERLMQDADIAEVQYYHFQKKIDRIKASFIGTKLAIVRIFTSLLPVGAIFLPLIKAAVTEPFKPMTGDISILTVYNNINSINGDVISGALTAAKTPTVFLLTGLALFAVSLLMIIIRFVLIMLSCSPKGRQRSTVMNIILLITTIGSAIAFLAMPEGGVVSGTLTYGAYLYILLQLVNAGVDFTVMKKGIPVNHKQCYVGGIPIEEYFEMQEKGMTTEEIRVIQYERLNAMQAEKKAQEKEETKAKEKTEEADNDG